MKKLANITFIVSFIILNIIFSINVNAVSKYSLNVEAPSTVDKGSNITLTFYANNISQIKNGYSGYSGVINYDSSRLEFVDIKSTVNGWNVYKSPSGNKINILGYDETPPTNTMMSDGKIFEVIFKVISLDNVNTKIEVSNIKGSTSIGDALEADPITKTITITEPQSPVVKSSDANLKSLSIEGHNLNPSFNPDTTSYNLNVSNDVKSLNINALASNNNSKIAITGNKNLSVGKNNIIVEVTAEDGTKKIYKIEVTRKSSNTNGTTNNNESKEKSNDNTLESIMGIPNLDFDPNKTDYDVIVPFDITNIIVSAKAKSDKAKVSISNGNLKDIELNKTNTVTITVTAEDSSIKIYTINIKRSEIKGETDLKELIINDKNIVNEDNGNGEYKITVPNNVDRLEISAVPANDSSTVKIKGNDKLKEGNNTIVVEVTDKNGFTKSYMINVERERSHFISGFLKDYWLLLIAILLTILIIILMIVFSKKNKKLIDEFNRKQELVYAGVESDTNAPIVLNNIDNEDDILYNSDSSIVDDTYVHMHNDEELVVQSILDDESISEVKKEMKIVKSEKLGSDDVEREYTITEKYRKK